MPVTIVDIARKVKVSHVTVSHVLNNRPNAFISDSTREKVLNTAREMGYVPNRAAKTLVTGRTQQVAFFSPAMDARFFQEAAYQLHSLLRGCGFEMVVGELGPKFMDPRCVDLLLRLGVDGILMYGGSLGDLQKVLEENIKILPPIVNMGLMCRGAVIDSVDIDISGPSRQAVEVLLAAGRKRVALMIPEYARESSDVRYCAYRDVMAKAGRVPEYIVTPDWLRNSARRTIQEYVQAKGCPEAIFCGNDELAIGAYRGLLDMGIRIPQDAVLIGCDGIQDIDYLEHPLSTIRQPIEAMCRRAWDCLSRRMENRNLPHQGMRLEGELVLRSPLDRFSAGSTT